MLIALIKRLHRDDGGHVQPFVGTVLGVPGAVVLTAGAIGDWDVVTAIGGAALAIGVLAATTLTHRGIDYGVFARLERLERER